MNPPVALIPAGGLSTRMGRPKLSLPLGGKAVLVWVIDSLRQAGIEKILTVIGPRVPELVPLALGAGSEVLLLEEQTKGMRGSVERGLEWIERTWRPSAQDRWLLVLADHPVLDPEVVRRLLREWEGQPASILIPTYQGHRGHPTLLGWRHAVGIRALDPGFRLNAYIRSQWAETREIPVDDPDILNDLDTPEDYERWQRVWQERGGRAGPSQG
jgi:molybdenum cofactor cytidylyltransferase